MSTHSQDKKTTRIFQQQFSPADESIPYRLVGTHEYGLAVPNLTRLMEISTEEQRKIYDEMLGVRPEFSFVSGVDVSGLQGTGPGKQAAPEWLDPFKRRGIPWMMALAKVELGATMSMYGRHKQPFTAFPPNQIDFEPFMNILLDDVVAQMGGLAADPGFRKVIDPRYRTDSWTLAYLRRIKLMRDMMSVLYTLNDSSINSRLLPLEKELRSNQEELVLRVSIAEMATFGTQTSTTFGRTHTRFTGQRCEELVNALQSENSTPPASSVPN